MPLLVYVKLLKDQDNQIINEKLLIMQKHKSKYRGHSISKRSRSNSVSSDTSNFSFLDMEDDEEVQTSDSIKENDNIKNTTGTVQGLKSDEKTHVSVEGDKISNTNLSSAGAIVEKGDDIGDKTKEEWEGEKGAGSDTLNAAAFTPERFAIKSGLAFLHVSCTLYSGILLIEYSRCNRKLLH